MKKVKAPDIYEFHDYRSYLEDLISFLKANKISLRKFAKEIGTTAANLSMIQKGKRGLSQELCESIANYLKLFPAQESYLKSMVTLNDDKDLQNKHDAYKKMKRHYKYQAHHGESLDSYLYLNDWINVAIREMKDLKGFKFSFDYIRKKLPSKVSSSRIRKAMDFLKQSGFLDASQEELPLLECVGGVYKLSLSKFHQDMMEQTVESIYEHDSSQRMIMGHTVALDEEDFSEGTAIIEEAIAKLQKLGEKKKNKKGKVYHFTMAGVPVTK